MGSKVGVLLWAGRVIMDGARGLLNWGKTSEKYEFVETPCVKCGGESMEKDPHVGHSHDDVLRVSLFGAREVTQHKMDLISSEFQ